MQFAERQGQLLEFPMRFHHGRAPANSPRDGELPATFHQRGQCVSDCFPQTIIDIMAEPSTACFAIRDQIAEAAKKEQGGDAASLGARIVESIEARRRSLQPWPRNAERGVHC